MSRASRYECLKLQHPFRLLCVGASHSGKSRFFDYVIRNMEKCIGGLGGSGKVDRLIVCYGVFDQLYAGWAEAAPLVVFHKGLPDEDELEGEQLAKKSLNNVMSKRTPPPPPLSQPPFVFFSNRGLG